MRPRESLKKHEAAPLPRVILVDANIFFSPRMRDVFMHLHESEVINVHWTREIEAEWTRNVIEKQNADQAGIEQCLLGMREAAEGWEVNGYQKYLDLFEAVDKKDRHVAAAAHKLSLVEWPGQPVVLVTRNLADFPLKAFDGTQIVRLSPAAYLELLFAEDAKRLLKVLDGCRKKLT